MKPTLRLGAGYGVADLGASLSFTAINTWLLFFLINVVGLAPVLAGVVFVVGRLFDAVLDPVAGLWLDRTRGRFSRTAIVGWGAIPLGTSFALLWIVPAGQFLPALGALMLFSLLYTVVQVPYLALTPDLTPDYDGRTELTGYRVGFGIVGSLLAAALPPAIVALVGSAPSLAASGSGGWILMGTVFGILTAGSYLVMAATVPEPAVLEPAVPESPTLEPAAPESIASDAFRALDAFAIHGFREILFCFVAITVGIMVVSSMLPFYLESALGVRPAQQTTVLGLFFGVAALAFPIWSLVSQRTGKRASLVAASLLLAASVLAIVYGAPTGGLSAFLLGGATVAGIALAGVMLLPWAMLPDVVEFGELTGTGRRQGTVYALFTFAQKLAGSVGVFASAIAAAVFGYQQGVAAQTAETVFGIELMVGPVAATAFVIAAVLAWQVPITRASHAAARAKLDARTDTSDR